jgi:subtilisin family serine protease
MRFILSIVCLLIAGSAYSQINKSVVSKRLLRQLETDPTGVHHFSILLADRVNVLQLESMLDSRQASLRERSQVVISELKQKAVATQDGILSFLKSHPQVEPKSVQAFWVTNVIFAKARREVIEKLSWRTDVAHIDWNAPLQLDAYTEVACAPVQPSLAPGRIEPGLSAINAPAMWALGYTGAGRVALGADTGIDPTHPAIRGQFRGLYQPVAQSWFEWENRSLYPNDCSNHGTHTIGTVLGLDRNTRDTIGVAFNASWIGAKIICNGNPGTIDNIAALQWALDPDGDSTTIADMPDVINNSWQDPSLQDECNSIYVDVLTSLETAGVSVVFSAGNAGPADTTVTPPHNINIGLVNTFTIAAVNGNSTLLPVADFSSRGPSKCGGEESYLIKPEVAAPGVNVRSCVPGGQYEALSGTSMSAPHVAGAILLLREAFPYLPGKEIKLALYYTARDLGEPGEDNTYGTGIIDVKAAFDYLVGQGHVPSDPTVQHDVVLIDAVSNEFNCDSIAAPVITFQNEGLDTLSEMDILLLIPALGFSDSLHWAGLLAPGEKAKLQLTGLIVKPGQWDLHIQLVNPNATFDGRPFNNRLSVPVWVSNRRSIDAYAAGSAQVCQGEQTLLRANFDGPGKAVIEWYDAPTGGRLLGSGQIFQTPALNTNRIFYADAKYTLNTGVAAASDPDSLVYPATNDVPGLVFDAFKNFTLKSVKVYAGKTGARFILLEDNTGKTVSTKIVPVSKLGEQRLTLNMNVSSGKGYRLVVGQGNPFGTDTGEFDYPYTVPDMLAIRGAADTTGVSEGRYSYFFDWEVEYREICGRKPVTVEVLDSAEMPQAAFAVSEKTLDVFNNPKVDFTDLSAGVVSWHWHFGDGSSSQEQHPSHTYRNEGTYVVSLSVSNAAGCSDFATDTIQVISLSSGTDDFNSEAQELHLFPNPTTGLVQAIFGQSATEVREILLADPLGRPLRSILPQALAGGRLLLDLSDQRPGVYVLVFKMEDGQLVRRIAKW